MLGKRLSQLRKQSKLKQGELAEIIGIARTTYGMYEQGQRQPDYETLEKLADYFEVTTDYLLGRSDKPKYTVEEQAAEYITSGEMDIEELKKYKLAWDGKPLSDEETERLFRIIKAYMTEE